ncbi:phage holin family protein [Adhaeribacter aquaticus]|uniref:phage holin family protein n=1 Tax=Adhaeribacter aquaticus TaxID=299567 RepID=UPI00040B7684|nr:phage holin family protein [Adhaeribacter aquaticus]
MDFIINLLVSAGVLLLLSYAMPQIHVKSFATALWVALLIGIFNATIGFLLRLPLNLVTLFLLQFVVRLIVTAVIIKIVDKLVRNFKVDGFWPALILAIALAIASTLVDRARTDESEYGYESLVNKQELLLT